MAATGEYRVISLPPRDVDTPDASPRGLTDGLRREGTAVIPRRPLSALTGDAASHGGAIDRPRQWYRANGGRLSPVASPALSLVSRRARASVLNLIRACFTARGRGCGARRQTTLRVLGIHARLAYADPGQPHWPGPPRSRIVAFRSRL